MNYAAQIEASRRRFAEAKTQRSIATMQKKYASLEPWKIETRVFWMAQILLEQGKATTETACDMARILVENEDKAKAVQPDLQVG